MDSVTTAIVAALIAGVAKGAAQVGQQTIHDAYNALKSALDKKYGAKSSLTNAINVLEGEPDFKPFQDAVSERVKQYEVEKDEEIKKLVQILMEELEQISTGRKNKAKYQIDVSNSQIGVVGDETKIEGGIRFGNQEPLDE